MGSTNLEDTHNYRQLTFSCRSLDCLLVSKLPRKETSCTARKVFAVWRLETRPLQSPLLMSVKKSQSHDAVLTQCLFPASSRADSRGWVLKILARVPHSSLAFH